MDLDCNRAPRLRSSVSARSRAKGLVQDLLAANLLIEFRDLTKYYILCKDMEAQKVNFTAAFHNQP